MKNTLRWGLALSGGGARGIIHVGVLQAFENHGFVPSCIAGASMGAVVGGLYAGGMKPTRMLEILSSASFLKMFSIKTGKSGIFDLRLLREVMKNNLPATFEELEIPLFVSASNISRDEAVIFHTGPLYQAILASASIPVILPPVEINGDKYVDGGVIDNLPASACLPFADRILGVEVNAGKFVNKISNMKDVALEVFHIIVKRNSAFGLSHCDSTIRPHLGSTYGLLDFSKAEKLFEIGLVEGEKWLRENVR